MSKHRKNQSVHCRRHRFHSFSFSCWSPLIFELCSSFRANCCNNSGDFLSERCSTNRNEGFAKKPNEFLQFFYFFSGKIISQVKLKTLVENVTFKYFKFPLAEKIEILISISVRDSIAELDRRLIF